MKTNNTHSRFGKWTAVILAAFLLLSSLSGCVVPADKEMREFLKAEDGYNADVQNAVARYGGLCHSVSIEYADGSTLNSNTCISEDGVVAFVDVDEGWYCIRYEDEWYCYYLDDDGNPCFLKYVVYDEDYSFDADYVDIGVIFGSGFLVDQGATLDKTEDGTYIWTNSYAFDDNTGTGTATIYLNADYEITEIEGAEYLEDGSLIATYTEKFTPGTQYEDLIPALAEALEEANGQTRHLTFNAVEDGVIVETLETDVPQGFYCRPILPPQYYDSEDNVDYFSDIELTQEYDPSEPYGDMDIYFSANVEK